MTKINPHSRSFWEKVMTPFVFLTGNPTKPHAMTIATTAPDGLALVHSATNPAEADYLRQVLQGEGFHVEYVPPVTTGIFGTTGSPHIFVAAEEEDEAREFLRQYLEGDVEEIPGEPGGEEHPF